MPTFRTRYEPLRELGRGGMGVVWLAADKDHGRQVAVKELTLEGAGRREALKRFRREARVLTRLVHPNIVKLLDYAEEGTEPYIVFEYLEGARSLDELLESGRAPADRLAVATGLVAGLACLHANRVLHRDLKPANVLIDAEGAPRIIDFGLARHNELSAEETRCTVDGQVLGTLAYMAPEQMLNSEVDLRADVYALGLVLLELFAGRLLFSHRSSTPVLATQRLSGRMPGLTTLVPGLDPRLDRLIGRCIALDPAHRPADALVVEKELDRCIAPAPEATTRVTVLDGAGRPPASPLRWVAATIVVLSLGTALALVPLLPRAAPTPPPSPTVVAAPPDRAGLLTALQQLLGDDDKRAMALMRRAEASATKSRSPPAEELRNAIDRRTLDELLARLRAHPPLRLSGVDAPPEDRRVLDRLNTLTLFDEYLSSMNEDPLFAPEVERLAGPFHELREFEPVRGDTVLHYGETLHEMGTAQWTMRIDDPPDRDAVVTLAFNAFDPKLVFELTINRALRLYFRNRLGTAEVRNYAVRDYLNVKNGKVESTDFSGGGIPRLVILSRRVPRSVLRRGDNGFQARFLDLPGRLELPGGRIWASTSLMRSATLWHTYLAFPR